MVPPLIPPLRDDHKRGVGEITGVVGAGPLVGQQYPQVGRHRVETGRVHDPGARGPGELVRTVDAVADEEHLPTEVGVVRTGPGARLHELDAVFRVRSHGRRDHARPPREGRQRGRVPGVGHDERPVSRSRAQPLAYGSEPLRGAPGQTEPHAGGGVLGQVRREQPADEPRRAIHDEVEFAVLRLTRRERHCCSPGMAPAPSADAGVRLIRRPMRASTPAITRLATMSTPWAT